MNPGTESGPTRRPVVVPRTVRSEAAVSTSPKGRRSPSARSGLPVAVRPSAAAPPEGVVRGVRAERGAGAGDAADRAEAAESTDPAEDADRPDDAEGPDVADAPER